MVILAGHSNDGWSEIKWETKEVNKMNATQRPSEKYGNLPEKKIRAGAISATIWLNKGHNDKGEETEFRTISVERNYTKDGQWHSTNSFRVGDLPKAAVAIQRAYEYLVLNEQDVFKAES